MIRPTLRLDEGKLIMQWLEQMIDRCALHSPGHARVYARMLGSFEAAFESYERGGSSKSPPQKGPKMDSMKDPVDTSTLVENMRLGQKKCPAHGLDLVVIEGPFTAGGKQFVRMACPDKFCERTFRLEP